jgi:glycosyltransferase 2 family protein
LKNAVRIVLFSILLSALGFGLLLLTGKKLDLSAFAGLVNIQPWGLALVVALLVLWWLLGGLRIKTLAGPDGDKITLSRASRAMLLSLFSAAVTPAAVGASFGLGWYLSRYIDAKRATAIALYGLVLDLVFYAWSLPVSFLVLELRHVNLEVPVVGPYIGLVVLLGSGTALTLAWALTFRISALERLVFWILKPRFLRRFRRGAYKFVRETGLALSGIRTMPLGTQLLLHVLTAASFLVHFIAFNAVAFGLGLKIDHVSIMAAQTMVVAASFVIPTPGGSGYFEFALGQLFRASKVPDTAVLPLIAIWRLISYYLYVLIGPFIGGPALLRASEEGGKPQAAND